MTKNVYVIVNKKTGKPIIDNSRLPFFWYKRTATERSNQIINSMVKPIEITKLNAFIGAGWKPVPTKKAKP